MGPRRHHTRSRLEKAPELLRARWVPELAQRLGLDLSDALAGDREVLPDLPQRVLAPVGEAEAEPQHLLLARGERVEKVLRLRFGLSGGCEHTLEEVGQDFAVTRERIRQIDAKALRKIRHPSRSKKLRSFLES